MNRFGSLFKPLMWFMALLLTALVAGCGGGGDSGGGAGASAGGAVCSGAGCVPLGTAGNFVILSQSGITDVPTSIITGDIGTSPITGAAIGVACPEVTGTIYAVDAAGPAPCSVTDATRLTAAVADRLTAFNDAADATLHPANTTDFNGGVIGGLVIPPGVHKFNSGVLVGTDITFAGTGSATDVWIFQISGNLLQATATNMILTGGALPQNIFWQVGGGAGVVIQATAQFKGVILAASTIALENGAKVDGRLLTAADVTLIADTVRRP